MKDRIKRFFSMSVSDLKYFNDEGDKIDVLNCPKGKEICNEHLKEINNNYVESSKYHLSKNFEKSIETLKDAYYLTSEIQDSSCVRCVGVFRGTIIESIENIYDELGKMSTGMCKTNRYQPIYKKTGEVLKELKDISGYKETKNLILQDYKDVG